MNERNNDALLPCPFCGGEVQFRKALWVSDGCTDAIIHDGKCGLTEFSTGTTDESVIAAWNRRASLCAPHADRCTRCGRYEDGQRPCPIGDSQCPVSASAAQPGVMQQWREEAERRMNAVSAAACQIGMGTTTPEVLLKAERVMLAHLSAVPTKE